jgi:hypothetical protein
MDAIRSLETVLISVSFSRRELTPGQIAISEIAGRKGQISLHVVTLLEFGWAESQSGIVVLCRSKLAAEKMKALTNWNERAYDGEEPASLS